MTPFVVDASFAASWFLPDEANPATTAFARQAAHVPPLTPSLFLHEMRSLFVMAARRGRGPKDDMLQQLDVVEKLYGKHAGSGRPRHRASGLQHNLTSYDATYLALALDHEAPLATLDKALAAAAKAEGVTIPDRWARHDVRERLCDRRAGGAPAAGGAGPFGRVADFGRDRNAHASRQDRHGPELAAGAGKRPRLSRGLVARFDRGAARLARPRDGRAALRRPSSVGRSGAREKSRPWHARCCGRRLACRGSSELDGPHAPATVRRRLALWATLHRWRGLEGPFSAPAIRNALRLAIRAADRPRARKSACAITRDILDELLATCGRGRAIDLRDRALLLLAFGSGGRRRSEIVRLRVDDLEERALVPADPRRRKGDAACAGHAIAAHQNLFGGRRRERAHGRPSGRRLARLARIFEYRRRPGVSAHRQMGTHRCRALDPQSVNGIIKSRCAAAGLDPAQFSAHGLRSGYLTQAAREGVSVPEAMQQSRHRSVQQASRYYNEAKSRGAGPRGWHREFETGSDR